MVISGVVVILAWQLGLLFAALYLAVWAMLMGRHALRKLVLTAHSEVLAAAAAFILAGALFVVYGLGYGVLHSTVSLSPFLTSLRDGRDEFMLALRGAVGIFGYYNVSLPSPMSQIWLLAATVFLAFALWMGSRRERVALGLVAAFAVAFPVVFYGFSYRYSGFGLQGRYVLPALVLVPVVAGHVIDRHAAAVPGRLGRPIRQLAVIGMATFQLVAWWINAHHWAASSDLLLTHASWAPPLGWRPWLLVAACGALAVAASAFVSSPKDRPEFAIPTQKVTLTTGLHEGE